MASTVIHMAVASEINKKLKRDNKKFLIGSIAPDISKQIGETKRLSHFLDDDDTNIPNIERFLYKYKNKLTDDFVMGYFVHLYTDYLWFKYFIPDIKDKDLITKLDGTVVKCYDGMFDQYVYNDYTNLNVRLFDEYDMDLSIFYNEVPAMDNIIEEIPYDKLQVILDRASVIIENSKVRKEFVFNMDNIKTFVKTSTDLILGKIEEIGELNGKLN